MEFPAQGHKKHPKRERDDWRGPKEQPQRRGQNDPPSVKDVAALGDVPYLLRTLRPSITIHPGRAIARRNHDYK